MIKRTKLIVALVVIATVVGSIVVYKLSESSPHALYPLVMELRFDNLPPLNTTANLTFSMSLNLNYLKSYGELVGNARVILVLPEGFTTTDNTMWEENNVAIGSNPISVTWAVTPVMVGNWTIRVDIEVENIVDKENQTRFWLLTGGKAISISVSENSAYIIENQENEDNGNLTVIIHG